MNESNIYFIGTSNKYMPHRKIEGMEEWKSKRAEYMRLWRKMNRQRAQEISHEANAKWRKEKHEDYILNKAKHRESLRQKILEFFGGKCIKCGNTDRRVLQVDHVNCDGYKMRIKKSGGIFGHYYRNDGGVYQTWKLIKIDPEKARCSRQLLCANCNWIKRHEMKEYLVDKLRDE